MTKRKQTGIEEINHTSIRLKKNSNQKQIADELGVNQRTTKKHLKSIHV